MRIRVALAAFPFVLSLALSFSCASLAQDGAPPVSEADLASFRWRSIGPANMGGRVADIAVAPSRPWTMYVGYGTGGVFKTTNNLTTLAPVFDGEAVASIGSIAVSPRNPDVVWVGTGEGNGRNSSSWGDGVYRSVDGGATWQNRGLGDSKDVPRIVIDPRNDDVVYAAALGHLWGDNDERGLYKTEDGGATWTAVLKSAPGAGCVDVVLDPANPDVVYAATYARRRTAWSFTSGGEGTGIFKSSDGGRTWKPLANGLPKEMGRVGLDVCRSAPNVVYAVIESDEGGAGDIGDLKSRAGGVFRSDDSGESWRRVSEIAPRGFYFAKVRVAANDPDFVYVLGFNVHVTKDGGKTWRHAGAKGIHIDCHALWVDPADPNHAVLGTDGGIYVTYDATETWDFVNSVATGEFYNVAVDMRRPYFVYGGLQDNGTWGGPSATLKDAAGFADPNDHSGITNADWFFLTNGDGFHVAVDPTNPNVVYSEMQGCDLYRTDLSNGKSVKLTPQPKEGSPAFRFNWNAPFQLSHHDPTVLYVGGNVVFRLTERGDRWSVISPDLTTKDPDKMATAGSVAEQHCTIVSLSESPRNAGILWAGSDDGRLHVTRDGGASWADVSGGLPESVRGLYVSRIEASHFEEGRAFVAIDGHRSDRYEPYLFATDDFGASFRPLASNLPAGGPVKVVREDLANADLLFAGTEFGIFASFDRGASWVPLKAGLPTVAVDDIVIHPRDRDLVIGTHGRSIYVLDDIGALEQATREVLSKEGPTLFAPRPALQFHFLSYGGVWGHRIFKAANPAFGATLHYFLPEHTTETVTVTIADAGGRVVRTLTGTRDPGFNRVTWDLQREEEERLESGEQKEFVPPGEYTVTLAVGKGAKLETKLLVEALPGV